MTETFQYAERPNKTALKREALVIFQLTQALVDLSEAQLQELQLDNTTLEAIVLAKQIKNKHVAFKRQLQYISKLLRQQDVDRLQTFIGNKAHQRTLEKGQHHELEYWRDRLIQEGDDALNQLLELHADNASLDRQHLRQLIRQAHKQEELNQPPAAKRALFQYLRDTLF